MEVIIYTNATNYVSTSAALIGGSDTSSVPTFSPALPEPGSLVLASIGAAALGLVAWRRRRRHA